MAHGGLGPQLTVCLYRVRGNVGAMYQCRVRATVEPEVMQRLVMRARVFSAYSIGVGTVGFVWETVGYLDFCIMAWDVSESEKCRESVRAFHQFRLLAHVLILS